LAKSCQNRKDSTRIRGIILGIDYFDERDEQATSEDCSRIRIALISKKLVIVAGNMIAMPLNQWHRESTSESQLLINSYRIRKQLINWKNLFSNLAAKWVSAKTPVSPH
jgi:hypothetical protein